MNPGLVLRATIVGPVRRSCGNMAAAAWQKRWSPPVAGGMTAGEGGGGGRV